MSRNYPETDFKSLEVLSNNHFVVNGKRNGIGRIMLYSMEDGKEITNQSVEEGYHGLVAVQRNFSPGRLRRE